MVSPHAGRRIGLVSAVGQLAGQRHMSLSTYRKSGAEVATPVWFAAADGKLYVFTAGDSGKVKRLRSSPRVRVAPSDARGYVRGPSQAGSARLLADRAAIEHAHAAMRAKYGWQMVMADFFSRLTGRLQKRAWIEIELT